MKYRILIALVVVLSGAIVLNTGNYAHGDGNGAPAGRTGSPADGLTCANTCHTGSAVTVSTGWITSNIPVAGYTPGMTYTITATATFNGRNEFGFEISPQDLVGNRIGTMANQSTQTQLVGGGKYITHTSTGTSGTNSKTWTFSWTAPAAGTGSFTFYGAFNATNNNNQSSGDLIFTDNLPVNEAATVGLDCGVFAITSPGSNACDSIISPVIKLSNFGTTTLDSVDISYYVDANTPSTYHWVGNLATQTSTIVALPTVTVTTAGTHTFTATTSNPNASTDVTTNNDTHSSTFNLVFAGGTLPFSEGFESTTFPPAGWQLLNPDGQTTWARNTAAHKTGVASAKLDNYNYSSVGQSDDLITPPIDLTTDPSPSLTFQVAYRLYTNPASSNPGSDTLTVLISTDCGASWSIIYKKYGTALTTLTPTFSTSAFTPTATQWRQETVSLAPYQTCAKAFLRFVNTTGYENNLYLDDIYINGPAAVNSVSATTTSLNLFPNPANNQLTMAYHLADRANVSWTLYDLTGKVILANKPEGEVAAGNYVEYLNVAEIPQGVYFLSMNMGGKIISQKVMITH